MTLYHVTPTKNVRSIRRKGLVRFQTSNWLQAGTGDRYGHGEIYAFESYRDALRWAGKMDWSLHSATGTGKISIVELEAGLTPWEVDDSDPLSQAGRRGAWLKSMLPVGPAQIIAAKRVDRAMLRELINGDA